MADERTGVPHATTEVAARHLATPNAAQKTTPAEQRKHARKLARRRHRDAERRADERDTRRAALEQLFFANSAFISDAVLADPRLTFQDADAIRYGVAHYLNKYKGKLTDAAFQRWVLDKIRPAVALCGQRDAFDRMIRECEGYVRAAIWKVLRTGQDLGICHQDCADEAAQRVWEWAVDHADSLLAPNQPAVPSTRLYEVARLQAKSIKADALRSRDKFDSVDLERIGRDGATGGIVIEPVPSDPDNPTPSPSRPAREKTLRRK